MAAKTITDSCAAHHLFRVQKKGKLGWGGGSTGQEFVLFYLMHKSACTGCQSNKMP